MKQEDKNLLIKDLSARLPYGVKITMPGLLNNECINNPKYYNVNTELHDYTPVEFNKILEYYEQL